MSKGIYYTAPSKASFEDMKRRAMDLWSEKSTAGGYAQEKIDLIKNITNVEDNFMYILAMFDEDNMRIIISRIHPATRADVRERAVDGGNPDWLLNSLGL